MIKVIGIKVIDRIKEAGLTQGILSKYAAHIISRLGFHEVTDSVCSREACIVLHLDGENDETVNMISELKSLGGIDIRQITFSPEELGSGNIVSSTGAEILGVLVEREPELAGKVQKILTSFGCNIRTRLGVNESFFGEPAGLIILELIGDEEQRLFLEKELKKLGKVHVRTMAF